MPSRPQLSLLVRTVLFVSTRQRQRKRKVQGEAIGSPWAFCFITKSRHTKLVSGRPFLAWRLLPDDSDVLCTPPLLNPSSFPESFEVFGGPFGIFPHQIPRCCLLSNLTIVIGHAAALSYCVLLLMLTEFSTIIKDWPRPAFPSHLCDVHLSSN